MGYNTNNGELNMKIGKYVFDHTTQSECSCGRCIDTGNSESPSGKTISVEFFDVGFIGDVDKEEFLKLLSEHKGEFCNIDFDDKKEHGYMEIGGWIGDQGLALRFMALGSFLGVFELMTPSNMMPDLPQDMRMQLATNGMVTVIKKGMAS